MGWDGTTMMQRQDEATALTGRGPQGWGELDSKEGVLGRCQGRRAHGGHHSQMTSPVPLTAPVGQGRRKSSWCLGCVCT